MKNEKAIDFTITGKSSNSADSYHLKLAYKGSGLFGFASRNPGFVSAIIIGMLLLGLFLDFIGLMMLLAGESKYNPNLYVYIGTSLIAFSGVIFTYINKLELNYAPHVFDWLVAHLEEENVYFSTGCEFNGSVESFDSGFAFHGNVIHRKIADGKYISKLPMGIIVLTSIHSDIRITAYMNALTKRKAILALRDRKDLLLEFFPDDVKINAALKAGEA
jgi:hypothetical protein